MAACCVTEVRGAGGDPWEMAPVAGIAGNGTGAVGIVWGHIYAKWYLKVV
jgi:hypothetical protein